MKSSLAILFCLAAPLIAGDRPAFYPFDITLGGTKAEMKPGNDLFAEVSQPVAADAMLELENQVPVLIVNAFACKEDGTVEEATAAAIIFANNVKGVKLDAAIDKKKLPPGTYLANVVVDNMTARIVFTVAAPHTKPKVDFSKVLGFLKKAGQ